MRPSRLAPVLLSILLLPFLVLSPTSMASAPLGIRHELRDMGVEESFVHVEARSVAAAMGSYCPLGEDCIPDPTVDRRTFSASAYGLQSPWGELCGGAGLTDQRDSFARVSARSQGGTACFEPRGDALAIASPHSDWIDVVVSLDRTVAGACDGGQRSVSGPVRMVGRVGDATLEMEGVLAARLPCDGTLL